MPPHPSTVSNACGWQAAAAAGWRAIGLRLLGAMLAVCVWLAASAAFAQTGLLPVPQLTDQVVDQTGTLSASQAAAIRTKLAALETRFGTQVVVLMVPTTAPEDIAAFAHRVADAWKIGRADVGDGLLLLVAKDDRTLRFEVARALEGSIPDLRAARIIDTQITPAFRRGDFSGGILAGLDGVEAALAGDPPPPPVATTPGATWGGGQAFHGFPRFDVIAVFVVAYFTFSAVGPHLRRVLGYKWGAVTSGGVVATVVYLFTGLLVGAFLAGLAGSALTLLMGTRLGVAIAQNSNQYRGGPGGFSGGGRSSRSGGGSFRSGRGGSFGGGGASGRW